MGETLEALSDFFIMAELWGIHGQLQRLREEQWLAASAIVASVESVHEAVEQLRDSVERQTTVIERGFAGIGARIDFQTYVLHKVLDALYQPSEVRARELRVRGDSAVHAKLYDDALEDLLHSLEENRYDFTCHFDAALISLEHLGDAEAAWESCELALRYAQLRSARPVDPSPAYYSSRSILLMARMLEDGGLLEDALTYYEAACTTSPDYGECFRRYASAAARLEYSELALAAARAAILVDETEAPLIEQEPGLVSIHDRVRALLTSMQKDAQRRASSLTPCAEASAAAYREVRQSLSDSDVVRACGWDESRESHHDLPADLLTRDGRLAGALERSMEFSRRGALLDTTQACLSLFQVADEVRRLIPRLTSFISPILDAAAEQSQTDLASARSWFAEENRSADLESRGLGQTGDLYQFSGLVGFLGFCAFWFGIAMAIGSIVGGGERYNVPAVAFTLGGLVAFVLWLYPTLWIKGDRWAKAGIRRSEARKVLDAAERTHSALDSAIRDAKSALKRLEELESTLLKSRDLMYTPEVLCSLILFDSGSRRGGYDEGEFARGLQEVAGGGLSFEEAKDIARNAPVVFLTDLPVPEAESVAAFLRREFGAVVGIKRRYVGELPRPS